MTKSVRRPRFGVRGMMIGVAAAAGLSAVALNWLPELARRRKVEAIVADQYRGLVDPGAAEVQAFWRLEEKRPGDLATLKASPRVVARRLLRLVEVGDDPAGGLPLEWRPPAYLPGAWAADRLGEWVVVADDLELGQETTACLFDLADGGSLRPEVETAVVGALLLQLSPRLGLDAGRQARATARVPGLAAGPASEWTSRQVELWARLAAEAGGRRDLLALLDLAAQDRRVARAVATSTAIAECRWPGLVSPLARLAATADEPRPLLESAAFTASRTGREALLGFAADESRPRPERRLAIHRLKRDPEGVAFLLGACEDPSRRATVAAFFGRDHARLADDPPPFDRRPTFSYAREAADPADPRPELRRLLDDLGRTGEPTARALREVDPEPLRLEAIAAGMSPMDADRAARARSRHALDLLREVAPDRSWSHDSTGEPSVAPIAWKDWFEALDRLRDPGDRLDDGFVLATLPADCVEVLARIARSPSSPHRVAALRLLVGRTERIEEVGPLIDSLEPAPGRDPRRLSSRDVESLRVLRRRFAVDHGWDVDGWRDWWARESAGGR